MNYYERHLGDYAKDTGHLSMLEHGAYTLLLDRYYSKEQGIPADEAYKVARARTAAEKAAVDAVLKEFFTLREGVWTKGRIEEEIAKAHTRISAAQENGKKGGRPKKNPAGSIQDGEQKPNGFSLGSVLETQTKALHTPDTNTSPSLRSGEGRASRLPPRPADVSEQTWVDWCQLRKGKKATVSETVVAEARKEAEKADMSLERFLGIWCLRGSQGLQADWLRADERNPSTKHAGFASKNYRHGVTEDGTFS